MDEKIICLLHLMEKVSNERDRAMKKRVEYVPGVFLSRAERDILDEVGRCPGIGVKTIAENKGITNGAVSQTVKVLAKNGLLTKRVSPVSEARICIHLTEEGKRNYQISEQRHKESYKEWEKILTQLNGNEIDRLIQLLKDIVKKVEMM